MSQPQQVSATEPEPNDPPPQQEPTHDVPVYPEQDPPPSRETAIEAGEKDEGGPREAGKGKILFDENKVAS